MTPQTLSQPLLTKITLPQVVIRFESLVIFAATLLVYHQFDFGWLQFGLLILLPDLSMIGYLFNKSVGGFLYNVFHTYSVALLFLGMGVFFGHTVVLQLSLIWLAHISADRLIGYGLKYADSFKHTHLDEI